MIISSHLQTELKTQSARSLLDEKIRRRAFASMGASQGGQFDSTLTNTASMLRNPWDCLITRLEALL